MQKGCRYKVIIVTKQNCLIHANTSEVQIAECYHNSVSRYDGDHTFTEITHLITTKLRIDHTKDFPKHSLIQLDDHNFERIVKDTTKDVLVFYYTQWCVKCKNLTEVVSRVAETFKVCTARIFSNNR